MSLRLLSLRILSLQLFRQPRPSNWTLATTLIATVVLAGVSLRTLTLRQSPTWPTVHRQIRQTFPAVQHISTTDLANWMKGDRPPLILDIREPEEFQVSQIEGAMLATTLNDVLAALENTPEDRPIVVYCSVGYRSSAVAQQLQDDGFTQVFNLEGSIFAWANEGRPIMRNAAPVQEVHPFNAKWGQLLERTLWSSDS
ncbi:MAG: rhodanese-like domain-containing protein [Cyanobacteria bacterium J06597_1]